VAAQAATVDEYLAQLPGDRRERLEVVRELCRRHLPDHDEVMKYGMPTYMRDGKANFAWASQARYLSLYFMNEAAVAANADRLAGHDMGKGCLRLKPSEEIDRELVGALLASTAASTDDPC